MYGNWVEMGSNYRILLPISRVFKIIYFYGQNLGSTYRVDIIKIATSNITSGYRKTATELGLRVVFTHVILLRR